jgi:hypothetical protein
MMVDSALMVVDGLKDDNDYAELPADALVLRAVLTATPSASAEASSVETAAAEATSMEAATTTEATSTEAATTETTDATEAARPSATNTGGVSKSVGRTTASSDGRLIA